MSRMILASLMTLALGLASPGQAAETRAAMAWAQITSRDLDAARQLIEQNHPGPVDSSNPAFRRWLDEGYKQASARAAAATSFSDYKRALLYYLNGFSDGHLLPLFWYDGIRQSWPGFIAGGSDDGTVRVTLSRTPDLPAGAVIQACDGVPIGQLLEERVLPFWWNREIPHERHLSIQRLFVTDPTDKASQLQRCTVMIGKQTRPIDLQWSFIRPQELQDLRTQALARIRPQLGLRRIGGLWFASISTFNPQGADETAFRALLDQLEQQSAELRSQTLVLDVRGNGGGNSAWGEEVAKRIWGQAWLDRVNQSFDSTVDWRVSPQNLERNRSAAPDLERQGLTEMAHFYRDLAQKMGVALARGEPFVRTGNSPAAQGAPPPNPVTGKIILLTDDVCFSACLDFADIVRKMPSVRHVGLPTSADTVYMEEVSHDLPSGLAAIRAPIKVYRHRIRASNQWYEPDVRWPGGLMTDEAVAKWIATLP